MKIPKFVNDGDEYKKFWNLDRFENRIKTEMGCTNSSCIVQNLAVDPFKLVSNSSVTTLL